MCIYDKIFLSLSLPSLPLPPLSLCLSSPSLPLLSPPSLSLLSLSLFPFVSPSPSLPLLSPPSLSFPLPPELLVTVVSAGTLIIKPGLGRTSHSTEQCSETSANQRRDIKISHTLCSFFKSQISAILSKTSGEVRVRWVQWGTCLNWRLLVGRERNSGHLGTVYCSPRMRLRHTLS